MSERDEIVSFTYETQGSDADICLGHGVQIGFLARRAKEEEAGNQPGVMPYGEDEELSLAFLDKNAVELVVANFKAGTVQGYAYDEGQGILTFRRWDSETGELVTETEVEPGVPGSVAHFRAMHTQLQTYVNAKYDDIPSGMESPEL